MYRLGEPETYDWDVFVLYWMLLLKANYVSIVVSNNSWLGCSLCLQL